MLKAQTGGRRTRVRQVQILILTVPHGTAHERLGRTLKQALEKARPGVTVETVNALHYCSRWFRAYYNSYQLPLKYWPQLWEWIEGYQHSHTATGPGWLYRRAAKALARLIRTSQPEIVIATEVGLCEMAALIRRREALDFRLIAVPTGIDTDRPWVQPEVDLYVVEPVQVAPFLEAQGIPHSRILACGVPVDPVYESLPTRSEARQKLGLIPDVPVLLILFGGSGIGNPSRMIAGLKNIPIRFQTVWIAGRSASLRRQLEHHLAGQENCRVLGWTDHMHEWMAASDLLLGKPGSGTVLEAINSGLPILAFDPLPGIERRTCDWIEAWQIGLWVRRPEQLAETIGKLLSHPEELQGFRANALSLARPGAARYASQSILNLLSC